MDTKNQSLSYTSIIKVLVVVAVLFVLYIIREVIAVLFVSLVFASAIDPFVDWMQKKKIHRAISVLLVYLILLVLAGLVIYAMIPPLTQEITQLAKTLPDYVNKIASIFAHWKDFAPQEEGSNLANTLQALSKTLADTTKSVFSTIGDIFGGFISLVVVLVITFYLTVEEEAIKKFIRFMVPARQENYILSLVSRIQSKMGMWLRGQLFLSLIVGALVYIGLLILDVKYALVLALVAGVLEIVPFIGPTMAAIPGVLVAFSDGWVKALIVVAVYFIVQQLENHLIVPKVMQKAVGLNPIVVIITIMIGAKLGGIVGALIAVPVAAGIGVFIGDVLRDKTDSKT